MSSTSTGTSRSNVRLALVCPMANEGSDAPRFVIEALRRCGGFCDVRFLAIVDSASRDNTVELLRDLATTELRLTLIWSPENSCVVDAYVRGYREALNIGADWILEIDAGFSHQPEDIPKFFEVMEHGYACVFGSRFMSGSRMSDISLKRYCISRGGTILTNLLLGTRLTDMTGGFELFSRGALEEVMARGLKSRAHFFQTEIKVICRHMKIAEVPIHYRAPSPRLKGAAIVDALKNLARLRKETR